MAIFHLSAQIISAAEGRSAVAAAAYRHGAEMRRNLDERDFNYRGKGDVEHEEMTLPPGAPPWANLRYGAGVSGGGSGAAPPAIAASARLWNDIEKRENQHSRRASAQLAREIEFSLPVEMTRAERVALARDFITNSLAGRGYTCDWVLHAKEENPHVHVMFSERVLAEGEGEWGNKIRTPNRRQQLLDLRAEWAMAANRHLEHGDYEVRIDHRSHEDLGLTIEPGVHRGSEPTNPAEHAAWQARVAEDQAIARANEAWLRENPGELVKLAGVGHEVVNRPILMEEALKRLQFPDMAAAVVYVEAAVEAGGLVPAMPAPAEPSPVREESRPPAPEEIRVEAPVPAAAEPVVEPPASEAWNTVIHLHQVREIMSVAEMLEAVRFGPAEAVDITALEALDLNEGQMLAAETILSADSRLGLVSGRAGTGKTHMLQAAAQLLTGQGIDVLGAATSGRAAAELSSPHIRTRTVAGWLQHRQAWTPTGRPFVFVLDEAGMVGVRDMAALAQAVETRGGKLVLVGDSGQLQPIAAGGPFRMLRDRYGAAEMDWVQRQNDKGDRVATIALARGKSRDALAHYAEKGAITLHGGTMAAAETIAANYWQMDGQTVALAHRNVDVDRLNDAIRAAGVARGEVGGFEQFATREAIVKFGEGDRVIAIASLSGHKILKGTFGRVGRGEDGALAITFDGHDDPVPLNDRTAGRIGLGYAVTIHKSQGMTADNAMVLATGTMDLNLGYVAFSRHREQLQIHVDRSSVDSVDQLSSRLRRRAGTGKEAAFAAAAAPGIKRAGPGIMEIDPHAESIIVHYSNLFAAAGPARIARTGTGRQYAADPSLLARHMATRRSAWTVEEAARELARHIEEPLTFRRILTTALQDPDVMTLLPESPEHPERLLSSWSRIQLEADMVADAGLLAERKVRVAGATAPAGDELTDEQRDTVTSLLGGLALQIVDGEAGAGKSTVAAALHDATAKAGVPISLVVPTRSDAVLAREAVTDPGNVQTARSPLPAGPEPRLWIVDGAETMTQEEMSGILRRARQTGGKVVLLGDRQAIQPLDAASPYLALGDRFPVMHMAGPLRPSLPEEREFIRQLASASPDDDHAALAWLEDEGRLVGAADMEGALNHAVAGFLDDPAADKVLIAHTRAQVRALNDAVKARLPDRQARAVRMLGGGSIDLAAGDIVVIDKAIEGSIVPQAHRAVVTSVSEDGGKISLDFGEHAESGRYASVATTSVRMGHAWARTVNSTRDAPASVHFLAGASTNRETVYAGLTRHGDQVSLYVPDPDAAGFAARQLATSGRQRFALDLADALTPDGQRMLADFLEDGGVGPEAWLERIHRTGRGHAMDRAMVDVGVGLADFGQSWFAHLLRMSAMGDEGSAQRMLPDAMFRNRPAPLIGTLFRDGRQPVTNAIGDALIRMSARPSGPAAAAAKAGWIRNASFALAVGAGERLPGPQPLHAAGSQKEIAKFLELGGGRQNNWLPRLFLDRRAETEARAMAGKRVDRQVRRGILADLGIGEDILDAPESWLMVGAAKREAYETRTAAALAAAKIAPTELDRAVARSLVAAEDRGDPELMRTGQALRDVVSAAPVRTPAELARDREDVLASLPRKGWSPAAGVFHELHRAFTPVEIDALMDDDKPLPASMPALPADRRQEIARYLLEQARYLTPSRSIPWASRVRERVPGYGMDFSR